MTIYALYIYTRKGQCIFRSTYHQQPVPQPPTKAILNKQRNEEKLLWGITYSLSDLVTQFNPNASMHTYRKQGSTSQQNGTGDQDAAVDIETYAKPCNTYSITTANYRLHYLCTLTGYRILLMSSPPVAPAVGAPTNASISAATVPPSNQSSGAYSDVLHNVYIVLSEVCMRNPLYKQGDPINASHAVQRINNIVQQSTAFI